MPDNIKEGVKFNRRTVLRNAAATATLGITSAAVAEARESGALTRSTSIQLIETATVYTGLPSRPTTYTDDFLLYLKPHSEKENKSRSNPSSAVLTPAGKELAEGEIKESTHFINTGNDFRLANGNDPSVSADGIRASHNDSGEGRVKHLPKETGENLSTSKLTPIREAHAIPGYNLHLRSDGAVDIEVKDRLVTVNPEEGTSIKLGKSEVDVNIPTDSIREIDDPRSVNPTGKVQMRETRSETFEVTPTIEIANLGQVDVLSID